jgi:hypothetical protein
MSSFWRKAGMNYLQYLEIGSKTMRMAMKEPAKSKAMTRGAIHFREGFWKNGELGERVIVEDLAQAPVKL